MKVVLFQPEIPQNTGNIVRTCAVTGTELLLVKPLGFSTSSRQLKRAGLDYWEGVDVSFTDNLEEILENTNQPFYFFSSKTDKIYTDTEYTEDDLLIFGSETSGLPKNFHEKWPDNFRTIPMLPGKRCLNLASSVAVVVYEAVRQREGLS